MNTLTCGYVPVGGCMGRSGQVRLCRSGMSWRSCMVQRESCVFAGEEV